MDPLPQAYVSRKWAELLVAAEELAGARTLDAVVQIVRRTARGISGAEGITFVRRTGEQCDYVAEDAVGPLWEGQCFDLEDCISGWVMLNGTSVVIPDIYVDPRVPHEVYRATFVKSLVMTPVGAGTTAAAIGAYWSDVGAPDEEAVALLATLARYVGAAIRNVGLNDALEVLNSTGAIVAAERDLERVVQQITDAGVALTGAEFGAFFYNVIDRRGESYMLYSLSGVPREAFERFPMPRNTQVFARTFTGEGTLRSDNIREDGRYGHSAPYHGMPEGHLPVTSYLSVPVISRTGEVHGGLFFGHQLPARFNEEHERLMLGIAGHAAIAIDNARLNQQAEAEIAARDAAEAELSSSNQRFRAAVDAVQGVLWTNTPDGRMEGDQPGWSALTGQGEAEYQGYGWSQRVHPDDAQPTIEAWHRAVADRSPFIFEHRLQRWDGEWRCFAVRAIPIIGDEGEVEQWVGVHTDVTDQRTAEAALKDFNATLESRIAQAVAEREEIEDVLRQAQKMEAVGQLTGGIAHDFNNLLTIIAGNMELVARKLGDGAEPGIARALANAQRGADRAATLTQRLLAFARKQPLAPKITDVGRLIAGMSDLLTRSLGEAVVIETISSAGLWRVEVDQNELESCLVNLAVNARDAMDGAGKLTIEAQNTVIDRDYAALHSEVAPGPYVVIAVTDTGAGMPPEIVAQAFDPFFTTKEVGRGTGLGLSQVYGFVKQSGGHVKIYSEPEQGTTVKLYLPRRLALEAPDDMPQHVNADRGNFDEAILVVEDDDDVRAYAVESLREQGYQVLEAYDGPAALKLLEQPGLRVDLLFTDVVMPGMTGRELADAAVLIHPQLKILFCSGYTRNAIMHNNRLDEGVEFLAKPFSLTQLSQRVREILDKRSLGRILFVDAEDGRRLLAVDLLKQLGFTMEQAATRFEALGLVRADHGGFDAVILDDAAALGDVDAIIREMHAIRADLPVLITRTSTGHRPDWERPFVGVVDKPYNAASLQDALAALNVTRRRHADGN